jgi:hypothetical protein
MENHRFSDVFIAISDGMIVPTGCPSVETPTMSESGRAYGQTIKGWLGPALTETFETPRLLKELGLSYVLDWCADDQPFPLKVPGMISVPYSIELNDVTMFVAKSLTGENFYQMVVDQFNQLYKEGETTGRVMALCLHPFIINQPFRQKYLERALDYIARHDDVWLTTSDGDRCALREKSCALRVVRGTVTSVICAALETRGRRFQDFWLSIRQADRQGAMRVENHFSPWLCVLSALGGASATASLLLILADYIQVVTSVG